jgi:hypothetical protein
MDPRAGMDDVKKKKNLDPTVIELQPLGRPARSQSLCTQRYPGSYNVNNYRLKSTQVSETDTCRQK